MHQGRILLTEVNTDKGNSSILFWLIHTIFQRRSARFHGKRKILIMHFVDMKFRMFL